MIFKGTISRGGCFKIYDFRNPISFYYKLSVIGDTPNIFVLNLELYHHQTNIYHHF